MGLYDIMPKGSQVKCWDNEMELKVVGSVVPSYHPEYIVLLREGGYVRVKEGVIIKIVENYGRKFYYPEDFPTFPCIDKWGDFIESRKDLEGIGLIGENYYKEV